MRYYAIYDRAYYVQMSNLRELNVPYLQIVYMYMHDESNKR